MRLDRLPRRVSVAIRLIHCAGDEGCTRRLRELGFDEGVEVEVLHHAPFGRDPIAVRVGGGTVALRRAQAAMVELEWREAAE